MRCRDRWAIAGSAVLVLVVFAAAAGCGHEPPRDAGRLASWSAEVAHTGQIPRFDSMGSRAVGYSGIGGLGADSSNIVIATPTGHSRQVPLPEWAANPNGHSPPNTLVGGPVGMFYQSAAGDNGQTFASVDTENPWSAACVDLDDVARLTAGDTDAGDCCMDR